MSQLRSDCCKAPIFVATGDEGTSCYICKECGEGCDPAL